MARPCCDKMGLNTGAWTPEEDQRLEHYIQKHGQANWHELSRLAGLARCGKSCRLRWMNYLRPGLKRGNFSEEEEEAIVRLHEELGNRWSKIAACLPGRTDNEIKNLWNTHLKRRLASEAPKPRRKRPRSEADSKTKFLIDQNEFLASNVMELWRNAYPSSSTSNSGRSVPPPSTYTASSDGCAADINGSNEEGSYELLEVSASSSCSSNDTYFFENLEPLGNDWQISSAAMSKGSSQADLDFFSDATANVLSEFWSLLGDVNIDKSSDVDIGSHFGPQVVV